MKKIISIFLFLLSFNSFATNYYTATTGSDSNNGNSINTPFKTINKGISVLKAGDTLYVRGGTYNEKIRSWLNGTSALPITISAYNNELPIIDGTNLASGNWDVLIMLGGQYNVLNGFEIKNFNMNGTYSGGYGIYISGPYNKISNCNVHHTWENGIVVSGDYGIVEDSKIWLTAYSKSKNPTNNAYNWSTGLTAARDTVNGITDGAILRRNIVYNNWGEGLSTYESNNITIEDNIVYDNYAVNLYASDTTNTTIQRNLVYTTQDSITLFSRASRGIALSNEVKNPLNNLKIINNIVYNTSAPFVYFANTGTNTLSNVLIAYNTFVNGIPGHAGNGTTVVFSPGTYTNVNFNNNIVLQENNYNIISVSASQTGITFNNNLWSKNPSSKAISNIDVIEDPKLAKIGSIWDIGFYMPQNSSPTINKGIYSNDVTLDYLKVVRPNSPTLGALEYNSTTTPPIITPPIDNSNNISLNKDITSSSTENSSYLAKYAFDGNLNTRWSSAFSDPQWITVDLGGLYTVNDIILYWESASAKEFKLQISDDNITWKDIYSTINGIGGTQEIVINNEHGRYIKLYGTKRNTVYGYSLWEIQVFGEEYTPPVIVPPVETRNNLATGKPVITSSIESSLLDGQYAVDNNLNTRWSSAFSDPQWITIDLGATFTINEVKLNWEVASAKEFKIQISPNNTYWNDLYSTTTSIGGSQNITVNGRGRYVRMLGTKRNTIYGYSLWEISVFGFIDPCQ